MACLKSNSKRVTTLFGDVARIPSYPLLLNIPDLLTSNSFRVTSSLRSSRPPATRLSHTGPPSSPRPSRVRTLRSSSPTSAPPPLPLLPPPAPPSPLLVPPLPPRRRRRRKKKPPMLTWVASSETTTEQQQVSQALQAPAEV